MGGSQEEAIEACLAVLAVQEASREPSSPVKYSVWAWLSMFDSKVCPQCERYHGDFWELTDPSDLERMFPYGYFVDAYTFKPMVHPNDRCHVERVRDYDVDNVLIRRVKT